MDVLSPFISVLCRPDWLFHGESCLRLDVVHPGRAWSSSPACTWHCSLHYLFSGQLPCFLMVRPKYASFLGFTTIQNAISLYGVCWSCGSQAGHLVSGSIRPQGNNLTALVTGDVPWWTIPKPQFGRKSQREVVPVLSDIYRTQYCARMMGNVFLYGIHYCRDSEASVHCSPDGTMFHGHRTLAMLHATSTDRRSTDTHNLDPLCTAQFLAV